MSNDLQVAAEHEVFVDEEGIDKYLEDEPEDTDELLEVDVVPLRRNTDPCNCCCMCKFKKFGQSYILYKSNSHQISVGPHWIGVVVTNALIIGATYGFLTRQYVRPRQSIYPYSQPMDRSANMSTFAIVVTFILAILSLVFLFLTSCTDPGVVLPGSNPPDECFRYCDICNLDQYAGTEHCEDCDQCIADYDHHCPWMGKCIGKKNMKWFQLFNITWVTYLVFVIGISIANIPTRFHHRRHIG